MDQAEYAGTGPLLGTVPQYPLDHRVHIADGAVGLEYRDDLRSFSTSERNQSSPLDTPARLGSPSLRRHHL